MVDDLELDDEEETVVRKPTEEEKTEQVETEGLPFDTEKARSDP